MRFRQVVRKATQVLALEVASEYKVNFVSIDVAIICAWFFETLQQHSLPEYF
jgi:hypothetical protein